MQLHEIIEAGPILYAAPIDTNPLAIVYSISGTTIYRYVWTPIMDGYIKTGERERVTNGDYPDFEGAVDEAQDWHTEEM